MSRDIQFLILDSRRVRTTIERMEFNIRWTWGISWILCEKTELHRRQSSSSSEKWETHLLHFGFIRHTAHYIIIPVADLSVFASPFKPAIPSIGATKSSDYDSWQPWLQVIDPHRTSLELPSVCFTCFQLRHVCDCDSR